ncbi:MAG: EamA family transporter [Candidatus Omnitrophota bacterium]
MNSLFLTWGMLILSVLCNAGGVFIIKWRLNEMGAIKCDSLRSVFAYFLLFIRSPLVILGLVLFFAAPFLFAIALSRMDITVAYPAQVGLNFLILIILAVFVLGEQMTSLKFIGIILVVLGIYFLNK